jgi:hypothetical protein
VLRILHQLKMWKELKSLELQQPEVQQLLELQQLEEQQQEGPRAPLPLVAQQVLGELQQLEEQPVLLLQAPPAQLHLNQNR